MLQRSISLIARAAITAPNFVLVEAKMLAGDAEASDLITRLSDDANVPILVIGDEASHPAWRRVLTPYDGDELAIRRA